jgi:large subunit ribosomal protein L15
MFLSELHPAKGSKKKPKRVGRGPGSGHGKTACKGEKGQKSRSGCQRNPGFEGGQMPLHRRVPKRGFTNIFRIPTQEVNVGRLDGFAAGVTVNPNSMYEVGLVSDPDRRIKILGDGELKVSLTVVADAFSKGARRAIEAAGGKAEERKP